MILDLFLITLCIVYVVDLSGFTTTIKEWLSYLLSKGLIVTSNYTIKPFTCSLCMTFWIGMLFLVLLGAFSIPYIFIVCMLSLLTSTLKDILLLIKDLISKGISSLYKYLNL